jgi:hypothetical protein
VGELSEPVLAAVDEAVRLVESLVEELSVAEPQEPKGGS